MPEAALSYHGAPSAPKPFNPYAHAARIRREARALLAAAGGGTPPRDPFAGIEDHFGEPVKAGRKTAGFKTVEVAR